MKKDADSYCQISIAGMKLRVPVYQNEERTLELAQELTERILEIERVSPTIDTQRFALEAAYALAVEVADEKEEHQRDIQELTKALAQLTSALEELVDRFQLDLPFEGE
jgi:cell division protein ZapA (FtsZ GTPase activity inhibitor)